MRAEELLRRYLEQRRELGERDLVLDDLSVEDVLRVIGAVRGGGESLAQGGGPAREPGGADWRAMLREAGATDAPPTERVPPGIVPPPADAAATPSPPAARSQAEPAAPADPSEPPAGIVVGSGERELFGGPLSRCASLSDVAELVRECQQCDLYRSATHPVPGEGNPHARLMCVGEAPGATEDATGRPFVGQAGQLLTKILAAIKLSRDDVFIANVLKHRPPGNRNPRPEEVDACRPYLERQVELIRPAVIVAFGTFAAQTLLETKLAIGKLRGQVHRYHGIPLVVTYHPAALLRNPAWKRPTWEDVQLARRILDRAGA